MCHAAATSAALHSDVPQYRARPDATMSCMAYAVSSIGVSGSGRWQNTRVVIDSLQVKGRARPTPFEREYTPHGVIFAVDGDKNLAFTVRWSGAEPGAAGELAAVALDRATSAAEFREALGRWKMPAAEFVRERTL